MTRGRVFLAAAGLFAVGLAVRAVPAADASHSWGCYKWSAPPNLTFNNQATSPYNSYYTQEADTAGDSWDNYTVVNFSPGTSGKNVKMQSGSYGSNGWLGMATISVNGCTIQSAIAKVNKTYLDNPPYNTADWRRKVVCHETGHTTGLNHNQNSTSCLLTGGYSQHHPNSHDAAQLDEMY